MLMVEGPGILCGTQVAGGDQEDQCAVDRILGPAIGRSLEVLADLPAPLASGDEAEKGVADPVLLGIACKLHNCKSIGGSLLCSLDHLAPVRMVRMIEERVEAQQGIGSGVLHLLGET